MAGGAIALVHKARLAWLVSVLTLASPVVHARATDDATRSAARQLGYDGDPSEIMSIQFTPDTQQAFDYWVDEVRFLTN